MAAFDAVEVQSGSVNTTPVGGTLFTFAGGIQELYVAATVDCYINFDEPAETTGSMLFKANYPPSRIVFDKANVQKIYVYAASGGTVYLTGMRR